MLRACVIEKRPNVIQASFERAMVVNNLSFQPTPTLVSSVLDVLISWSDEGKLALFGSALVAVLGLCDQSPNDIDFVLPATDIHMLLSQLTTAGAMPAKSSNALLDSADGAPFKTYNVLVGSLRIQLSVVLLRFGDDSSSGGGGGGVADARAAKLASHLLLCSTTAYSAMYSAGTVFELQPDLRNRLLIRPCCAPSVFPLLLFGRYTVSGESGGEVVDPWRTAHLFAAYAVLTRRLRLPPAVTMTVNRINAYARATTKNERQPYFFTGIQALVAAATAVRAINFAIGGVAPPTTALSAFDTEHKGPRSARAAARRLYWLLNKGFQPAPDLYWENFLVPAIIASLPNDTTRSVWQECGATAYLQACCEKEIFASEIIDEEVKVEVEAAIVSSARAATAHVPSSSSASVSGLGAGGWKGKG